MERSKKIKNKFNIIILKNMDKTIQEKAEFLRTKGYEIGVAEGTEDYPAHVTKKGTQLNCSVNYAYYNIEKI